METRFRSIAKKASEFVGTPKFFIINIVALVLWALWGVFFGVSDTWQLVMTTGLTITTQLLVILIQASQNSDTVAIHAKLDELIRAIPEADDKLQRIEQPENMR